MVILDTHKLVEEMIAAGLKKKQAEVITAAISQSNNDLVTKNDLELAISGLRNDNKWLKALMFVIIGLLVKVAFF
jgi:hypothetical protein